MSEKIINLDNYRENKESQNSFNQAEYLDELNKEFLTLMKHSKRDLVVHNDDLENFKLNNLDRSAVIDQIDKISNLRKELILEVSKLIKEIRSDA